MDSETQHSLSSAAGPIRLRELAASDLATLFAHQNDPEGNRMALVVPRGWEVFEAHWSRILTNPEVTARGILFDEKLVGQVSCFRMDERRWVGYWIDREYWGRGVATQALAMLLPQLAERPIYACVAVANVGSRRVLEKCGFAEAERRMCPGDDRYLACEEVILKFA
jgi:RimJ/RimL family protein N-acetyltransferase